MMNTPRIVEWLNAFIATHQAQHPTAGWPPPGSPSAKRLWGKWFDRFKAIGVTQAEAEAASKEFGCVTLWCDEHPAIIVSIVEAQRIEAQEAKVQPATRPERLPASKFDFPPGVADCRQYWRYLVAKLTDGTAEGGVVRARDGRVE